MSLGGCLAGSSSPVGAPLGVGVAPLSLPGIADACYHLIVTNEAGGAGEVVWDKKQICASQYGDGQSSVSYIGTCDASPDGRVNSVTLEIDDLFAKGDDGKLSALKSPDDYVNPCPGGDGRCVLDVPCAENADTAVTFNLTVLRSANQGFFDIAVNFEDIFCSSKIDCAYDKDGDKPIELLFDGQGDRKQTAVVALACTRGPGEDQGTVLHMNGPRVVCGEAGPAANTPFSFARTCVSSGEVFGAAAEVDNGEPVSVSPVMMTASEAVLLPLTLGGQVWTGGLVATRIDDDHVLGFVTTNVVFDPAFAVWARDVGGSWELVSVAPTGASQLVIDHVYYDTSRALAWAALLDADDKTRLASVQVGAGGQLGAVWLSPADPGHDTHVSGANDDYVLLENDGYGAGTTDYEAHVYELSAMNEVTPPGIGAVRSSALLCGDRLVVTKNSSGPYVTEQWILGGGGPTQLFFGAVAHASGDILVSNSQPPEMWVCGANGTWETGTPSEIGFEVRGVIPGTRTVYGVFGGQPTLATLPSGGGDWSLSALPMPGDCGSGWGFDGFAPRAASDKVTLLARCNDNLGLAWELSTTATSAAISAWYRLAFQGTGDFRGVVSAGGGLVNLFMRAESGPSCGALLGGVDVSNGVASASWELGGASGASIQPLVYPFPERDSAASGTSWQIDIDPTFEGNLWSPPHDGDPVFQVGSYHGTESLDCGGEPCNKVYWNVAVGFDPTASNCHLEWEATAAPAPGLPGGVTDKNTVYPVLSGSVQLTSDASKGPVEMVCRQNPLNGEGSGVQTGYTGIGKPHAFCFGFDGGKPWSVEGCTWGVVRDTTPRADGTSKADEKGAAK